MAALFGGRQARANTPNSLGAPAALTIQTSIQGKPRAIGWGTAMIAGNLLDLVDFTPVVVADYTTNPATSAGKGFGRSAQSSQPTYSYVYYANVLIGLSEGPILGILDFTGDGLVQSTYGDGDSGAYNFNGDQTQLPFSTFATMHPDRALAYRGLAYLANYPMYLGANTSIPNFQFETVFANYIGMGSDFPNDVNPAYINYDLLTNLYYGVPGWTTSLVGDLTPYQNFCQAMGLAMSPVLADQQEAAGFLSSIMEATYSEFCWSNGQLHMVPYGEVSTTGHGATYTANTTPIYYLTIDDFQPLQGGSSVIPGTPIGFRRKPSDEIKNNVKIEWLDRTQTYSPAQIDHKDEASIVSSFERPTDVRQHHFFKLKDAAAMSASLQLLREQVVGTYYFTLNKTFILLDLMDLVTLPLDELGITDEPVTVRIKEIQENSDYTLTFTAEEFFGAASAPLYTRQGASHGIPDFNVDPGVINPPVVFEVPQSADKSGGLNVYAAISGVDVPHYGGCDIYASYDNATFIRIEKLLGASRMGVSTNAIGTVGNSDTHDYIDIGETLGVDLSESGGVLNPGSGVDMIARSTLCWLESDSQGAFYRASSGTYPDSSGIMQTAGVNVQRLKYVWNGSAWVAAGVLLEGSAVNYALDSGLDTTDDSKWITDDNTIVTVSTTHAPDGVSFMKQVKAGTNHGPGVYSGLVYSAFPLATNLLNTTTRAKSLFVKKINWNYVYLLIGCDVRNYALVVFDITTGAITQKAVGPTSGEIVNAYVENWGGGLFRLVIAGSVNHPNIQGAFMQFGLAPSATNTLDDYGDPIGTWAGTEAFLAWGADVEEGDHATSYIPTVGSIGLRAADVSNYADRGELISFSTVSLTSAYHYNISPILRGAYGTAIVPHSTGKKFVRLDGLVAKIPYDPTNIGQTLYLKFVPFNVYGGGQKTLADATAYTYQIAGVSAAAEVVTDSSLGHAVNQDFVDAVNAHIGDITVTQQVSSSAAQAIAVSTNDVRADFENLGFSVADISESMTAIANATGAFSTYNQTISATYGSMAAAVSTNISAIAGNSAAIGTNSADIFANTTNINSNTSAIGANTSAIGGINANLSATWSVTVDINSKISGIRLYGSSTTSSFDIRVDSFNLYATGYSLQPVFSIGTIGGVASIVINGQKLDDISVLNQAIGNNSVSNGSASTGRASGTNTSGTASLTARGGARVVIAATYSGGTHVTGASSFRAGLLDITYTPPGGSAVTKSFVIPNFWSGSSLQTIDNMTCTAIIQLAGVGAGTWQAFARSYLPAVGDYIDVDTTIIIQEYSK
jgi:hypothetical protein